MRAVMAALGQLLAMTVKFQKVRDQAGRLVFS
jgi:hypothetical protein